MIVTGSWDKTIKYWDLRQQTAVASVECQERVYSMDAKDNLIVIGTADRYVNIIKFDNPTALHETRQSPLRYQTRVVSCFADAAGFAIGSIEGRCAFQYINKKDEVYRTGRTYKIISNSNIELKLYVQVSSRPAEK